uniref:Heme-binding protein 2 n=1 Tax=Leptobrachium leishanense TaxID=445787 RepID=A0A8C5MFS7_9ANUR
MCSRLRTVLSLLCLYGSEISSDDHYTPPEFCRDAKCPRYELLETHEEYELRAYVSTNWVITGMNKTMERESISSSFICLARYTRGLNSKGMKMEMAVPVVIFIPLKEESIFPPSMAFFLPPDLDAPQPSDSKLKFLILPEVQLYVRSFGGYAEPDDVSQNIQTLSNALVTHNKSFDTSFSGFNIYDSPHEVFDRHNEVFFVAG